MEEKIGLKKSDTKKKKDTTMAAQKRIF